MTQSRGNEVLYLIMISFYSSKLIFGKMCVGHLWLLSLFSWLKICLECTTNGLLIFLA